MARESEWLGFLIVPASTLFKSYTISTLRADDTFPTHRNIYVYHRHGLSSSASPAQRASLLCGYLVCAHATARYGMSFCHGFGCVVLAAWTLLLPGRHPSPVSPADLVRKALAQRRPVP